MVMLLPRLRIARKFIATSVKDQAENGTIRVGACLCGKDDLDTIIQISDRWARRAFMRVRDCIHEDVRLAFQTYARTMFIKRYDDRFFPESGDCYNYFRETVLSPLFKTQTRIRSWQKSLEAIRRLGLLKVLLTIYLKIVPYKLQKGATEDDLREDTYNVFALVGGVAEKDGKRIPLSYSGKTLKVAIVLVNALTATSMLHYVKMIENFSRSGIEAIFVLGAGFANIEVARFSAMKFFARNRATWLFKDVAPYQIECEGRENLACCMLLEKME